MQFCFHSSHTYDYLEQWLEEGNSPNLEGIGYPLIMHAVNKNHIECLKLLIKYGANINQSNASGETAIYMACERGHYECLIYLLTFKDPNYGRSQMFCTSALDIAILNCHTLCAFALIDRGMTFNKERLHERFDRFGHVNALDLLSIDEINKVIHECEAYSIPQIKEPEDVDN
jgi:hypothetical protein